jgi:hypothetical protein
LDENTGLSAYQGQHYRNIPEFSVNIGSHDCLAKIKETGSGGQNA